MKRILTMACASILLGACSSPDGSLGGGGSSDGDTSSTDTSVDITDAILSERSADCIDYIKSYTSSVTDVQQATNFDGSLVVTANDAKTSCYFTSNQIPNHDFNDTTANFANDVSANVAIYKVPASPTIASTTTALSIGTDNAIFLNGVKLDLLSAGCFGVGDGKIGCNDMTAKWRKDPMSSNNNFGTDAHNAHTQPDGTYHYHGNPEALFNDLDSSKESPVVGFAADGFPIYGSYFSDNGLIRKATSSYRKKLGSREYYYGIDPGGLYDGTYIDDYEYINGLGDLDACNGMTVNGQYGYYVTDSYPWVMGCFSGTPDSSFNK